MILVAPCFVHSILVKKQRLILITKAYGTY
jgi:hypothetical protein